MPELLFIIIIIIPLLFFQKKAARSGCRAAVGPGFHKSASKDAFKCETIKLLRRLSVCEWLLLISLFASPTRPHVSPT